MCTGIYKQLHRFKGTTGILTMVMKNKLRTTYLGNNEVHKLGICNKHFFLFWGSLVLAQYPSLFNNSNFLFALLAKFMEV